MEESTAASSRTTIYSPQQRIAVEQALHRLHEAGLIVLEPSKKGLPGYELSIPFLQRARHLAPPQSQAQ